MVRDKLLTVKCSAAELALFTGLAKAKHTNISELVRQTLFRDARKIFGPRKLDSMLAEVIQ